MAQHSSLARLTFDRLFCGDALMHKLSDSASVRAAASSFRARYPAAPLPIPLASAFLRDLLSSGDVGASAALLASHPHADRIVPAALPVDTVLRVTAALPADAQLRSVLFASATHNLSDNNTTSRNFSESHIMSSDPSEIHTATSVPSENDATHSDPNESHATSSNFSEIHPATSDPSEIQTARSDPSAASCATRHAILRQIRDSPRSSGALLRLLCGLSDAGRAGDRAAAHDALLAALRQSFVAPADFAPVLRLLARGGEHRRVLALWAWMRHSSARWDKEAASAIIISAALSRKMNVAIGAIQTLAEANEDPTLEAQRYFIRHLASRAPPQPRYADQLVAHWHPDSAQLWTTPAREVGVELLFVHYKIKNYARVRELLEAAGKAARTEEERHEILRLPGMAFILRHFAVEVEQELWLKELCSSGLSMKDLADFPLIAGFLASLTRHNGDVESFLNVARELKMTAENFEKMTNFVADDIYFKNAKETLAFITTLAEAFSLEVPTDVSSWLQLLG